MSTVRIFMDPLGEVDQRIAAIKAIVRSADRPLRTAAFEEWKELLTQRLRWQLALVDGHQPPFIVKERLR